MVRRATLTPNVFPSKSRAVRIGASFATIAAYGADYKIAAGNTAAKCRAPHLPATDGRRRYRCPGGDRGDPVGAAGDGVVSTSEADPRKGVSFA